MKIHATFANRKYDPEVMELVDAWDEYSVDENPEGFKESRQEALDSWGDELHRWVTVDINISSADEDVILEALQDSSVTVSGRVSATVIGEEP